MKIVIIAGSEKDQKHVDALAEQLKEKDLGWPHIYYCSAHKEPRRLLDIIEEYGSNQKVIFITVAGRSNALSGMVAANTFHPTLACPPFEGLLDYMVDINSTLRMPSDTPVLTVIGVDNCTQAVARLTNLAR